mgnify:FL=1
MKLDALGMLPHDPSPETIQERAAWIRSRWTVEEERQRRTGSTVRRRVDIKTFAVRHRDLVCEPI